MKENFLRLRLTENPVGRNMKHNISDIDGKIFIHPETKKYFGTIRIDETTRGTIIKGSEKYDVFAEDGCGNLFVSTAGREIFFWDHETEMITLLAHSLTAFRQNCVNENEISIDVDSDQVVSVWIDPEFAKKMNMENVPDDGWIKK
jgi:hypothetical protein